MKKISESYINRASNSYSPNIELDITSGGKIKRIKVSFNVSVEDLILFLEEVVTSRMTSRTVR